MQKIVVTPRMWYPDLSFIVDPPADLISALKLRVLGELCFFAEADWLATVYK
jgi:hypothetical protein